MRMGLKIFGLTTRLNDKARLSKDSFIISEKVNSLKHFLSVGEINIGTNVVGKQNKTGAAHF